MSVLLSMLKGVFAEKATVSPGLVSETQDFNDGVPHEEMLNIARARFPGPIYLDWLKWFHATLRPEMYHRSALNPGSHCNTQCHPPEP